MTVQDFRFFQPFPPKCNRILTRGDLSRGLSFADGFQHFTHAWTGRQPQFAHHIIAVQKFRRGDNFFGVFPVIFEEDAADIQRGRPGLLFELVAVRGTQVGQRQQDQVGTRFAAVFEEAIDGAAGGVFALAVLAAGVEVDAHVVLDDQPS